MGNFNRKWVKKLQDDILFELERKCRDLDLSKRPDRVKLAGILAQELAWVVFPEQNL